MCYTGVKKYKVLQSLQFKFKEVKSVPRIGSTRAPAQHIHSGDGGDSVKCIERIAAHEELGKEMNDLLLAQVRGKQIIVACIVGGSRLALLGAADGVISTSNMPPPWTPCSLSLMQPPSNG